MSFFRWLTGYRKPQRTGTHPRQHVHGHAADPAASLRTERTERRERLYAVVREAMVRAGVLSAGYKFKVLSLDQRGHQFMVMVDLAREYGGETVRLSAIEALIVQTAQARFDIGVTAVYWRISDRVGIAAGAPAPAAAAAAAGPARPQPLAARAAAARSQAPGASSPGVPAPDAAAPAGLAMAPASAGPSGGGFFEPIGADEVEAFKQALRAGSASRPAAAPPQPPAGAAAAALADSVRVGPLHGRAASGRTGFEDTQQTHGSGSSGLPDHLSTTQFGDL